MGLVVHVLNKMLVDMMIGRQPYPGRPRGGRGRSSLNMDHGLDSQNDENLQTVLMYCFAGWQVQEINNC